MNEHDFMKNMVRNRIVNDDRIKRGAKIGAEETKRRLRRALIPALTAVGSIAVLIGVTMSIPSARAEVLSWFQPKTPGEYIAADPEDRDPIPELEAMIVTPAPTEAAVSVTAPASEETNVPSETPAPTKAPEPTDMPSEIGSEPNEELWDEIRENFSAHIGETIFDGHTLYMTVDLDGVCGLLAYESDNLRSYPAGTPHLFWLYEKIAPEYVKYFYEESANLTRYYSGAMELWMAPDCFVQLILDEEEQIMLSGWVSFVERPIDRAFSQELKKEFGYHETYTEEAAAEIRARLLEHFRQNGARAIMTLYLEDGLATPVGPKSSGKHVYDYLDENGYMEAKAVFRVILDHGTNENTEVKFQTEIGTVGMKMTAFKNLSKRKITTKDDPVEFSGETVFYEHVWDDAYRNWALINRQIDLNGASISLKDTGGYLDILGIHELKLSLTMPDDWSVETKWAFARTLRFEVTIDSDLSVGTYSAYVWPESDGTFTLTFPEISDIPFNRFKTIESIRLTPMYDCCTTVSVCEREQVGAELPRTVLYTVPMGPNDSFRSETAGEGTVVEWDFETVQHPEWAITLTVN